MNKKQIKRIETLLDEEFKIAWFIDDKMGNEGGDDFLPNNPNYIFYQGMVKAIETLGYVINRNNMKHYIYK